METRSKDKQAAAKGGSQGPADDNASETGQVSETESQQEVYQEAQQPQTPTRGQTHEQVASGSGASTQTGGDRGGIDQPRERQGSRSSGPTSRDVGFGGTSREQSSEIVHGAEAPAGPVGERQGPGVVPQEGGRPLRYESREGGERQLYKDLTGLTSGQQAPEDDSEARRKRISFEVPKEIRRDRSSSSESAGWSTGSHGGKEAKLRIKPESLPKFSGESDPKKGGKALRDVDTWTDQVDAVTRNAGVSEDVLLSWLPILIVDTALQWYVSPLTQSKHYQTWDEWKQAFRTRFRVPFYEAEMHDKCHKLKLDVNKPFADYYDQKSDLISKVYGSQISNEVIIRQLCEGVPREFVALVTATMTRRTPEDFRAALMQVELTYGKQGQEKTEDKQKSDKKSNKSEQTERKSNNGSRDDRKSRGYSRGPRRGYGNRRDDRSSKQNGSTRDEKEQEKQRKDDKEKGNCYKCHKKGHMANECPGDKSKEKKEEKKEPAKAVTNMAVVQKTATTCYAYRKTRRSSSAESADPDEGKEEEGSSRVRTRSQRAANHFENRTKSNSPSEEPRTPTKTIDTRRSTKKKKPERRSSSGSKGFRGTEKRYSRFEREEQRDFSPTPTSESTESEPDEPEIKHKLSDIPEEERDQPTPAYVRVRLNSSKELFQACVDTGSSLSLIDEGFMARYLPTLTIKKIPMMTIVGIGGGIQILGKVVIRVSILAKREKPIQTEALSVSFPVEFYVTPRNITQVILGVDTLRRAEMTISPSEKVATFENIEGVVCPLIVAEEHEQPKPRKGRMAKNYSGPYKVFAKGATILKPRHIAQVAVQVKGLSCNLARPLLVEGDPSFRKNSTMTAAARTLINAAEKRPVVQMVNLGRNPVRIDPSEPIGMAYFIDEPRYQPQCNSSVPTAEDDETAFREAVKVLDVNTELSPEQREALWDVLLRNRRAFAYGARPIGFTRMEKMTIETGSHEPISQPPYRASPRGRQIISDTIKDLEDLDIIEDSDSAWASPVVLVNREGETRFCVDFRKLNAATRKDQYPLPRIDDTLGAFKGKKWFSSFDANKGFHQVEVAEEDRPKTAFRTHEGLKQYKRMPFGIHKGPAVFQRLMDKILAQHKWNCALAYIDDVIVYSDTFEEHVKHLEAVLGRVALSGLTLSIKKSHVAYQKMEALGHTISDLGIGTKPKNVEAITKFPRPKNVAELRRFLGKAGHYRKYIKQYSVICSPLTDLTSKKKGWSWTAECEEAFRFIKDAMTTAPILAHPDQTKPYIMYTDASKEGIGVILQQKQDDGTEHPVIYLSRKLSKAEKNYSATELEGLAVVWGYKKLHAYLEGANVTVVTDHSALRWLFEHDGTNQRLSRWIMYLQPFRPMMNIVYRQGRVHEDVDALSRAPVGEPESEIDDGIPEIPTRHVTNMVEVTSKLDDDFVKELKDATRDDVFATLLEKDKENKDSPHYKKFKLQDGLWYRTNVEGGYALYIPSSAKKLRTAIIKSCHDEVIAAHQGIARTIEKIKGIFWWEGMVKDIENYVRTCESCQRNKAENRSFPSGLNPIDIPPERWHTLTMDFTKLPKTKEGYDQLTVVVDKFTKRIRMWPSKSTDTALDVAKQFMDNIVKIHGVPKKLITDRDSLFTSNFWKELWKTYQVKMAFSTSYHPQTDGQTERANRIIKEALRHYVVGKRDDWVEHIPMLEFAHNSSVNSVTGLTPFDLDLGRPVRHPLATLALPDNAPEALHEWQDRMTVAYYEAREKLEAEQDRQAGYANRGRKLYQYDVGDQVMVSSKHLLPAWMPQTFSLGYRSLLPKYYGPYTVTKKITDGAYELAFPEEIKAHNVVNAEYLKPYRADLENFPDRNQPPPPPVEVDGETEYEVEAILDERQRHGKTQCLVRWKGYDESHNSWEPISELEDTEAYEKWKNAKVTNMVVWKNPHGSEAKRRRIAEEEKHEATTAEEVPQETEPEYKDEMDLADVTLSDMED